VIGLGPRSDALEKLAATAAGEPLDVLVVGGGITGAGIALDAASRGASVGLVEGRDFASGTSSKSSKLVHGGLRYLEQREFGLMREACTERDLLRRLAPHLVEAVPFVLPVSHRSTRAKFGVGLWAYDALASFRNMKIHKHIDADEAEHLVPPLPKGKVRGGYLFYDCKNDDVRLVMENLIQARRYGATVANHLAVRHLEGEVGDCRALVEDTPTADLFEIRARRVVVAAGVWADRVENLARADARPRLRPSKGIHLVFDKATVPLEETAAFIPDAERRRMLFVIPWLDAVVVGTTDDTYEGDLDRPSVTDEDRAYILDAVNHSFSLELTSTDIVGAYAGLRPLIAAKEGATADLSRRHSVYDIAPGIIGITGGKLTTYRRMAADAVDRLSEDGGISSRSRTRWIRLGSHDPASLTQAVERRAARLGIGGSSVAGLVRTYGDRALEVIDIAESTGNAEPLVPGRSPLAAEAEYCVRHEMVVDLDDLLSRRTRLALVDRAAGIGPGSNAPAALASALGWDREEEERQTLAYRAGVETERGLPLGAPSPIEAPTREQTG
jgi:glycerol-3-phosphate dehydrogenase